MALPHVFIRGPFPRHQPSYSDDSCHDREAKREGSVCLQSKSAPGIYTRDPNLFPAKALSVVVSVSQWADRGRRLSAESSAEPGPWRTDRAPFQRGIMPSVPVVVMQASAQCGKTEIMMNALGCHIDLDPCPTMVVQPTVDMAMAFSKDRLRPMLRDTPALQGRVLDERNRDGTQTLLGKGFPGGHLTLAGANSPASLAQRPIRLIIADDVDRFPPVVGEEGEDRRAVSVSDRGFWVEVLR